MPCGLRSTQRPILMSRRLRLDAELVRRGLARSREHARELIGAGAVSVQGQIAHKPATAVTTDSAIVVKQSLEKKWVSRGAHKLISALEVFEPLGLSVVGKRALDAGASTGGFTEVLLDRGVSSVIAVDVGYGQLAWSLQTDDRVEVLDRTNIRHLTLEQIGEPVDLIVSDLSFISLTLVMEALTKLCRDDGDIVLMIKPQFEVGKDQVGKSGVVRDRDLHIQAVRQVCDAAYVAKWGTVALAPSMLPGPAGNVEFFCWLRKDAGPISDELVEQAVAAAPGGET